MDVVTDYHCTAVQAKKWTLLRQSELRRCVARFRFFLQEFMRASPANRTVWTISMSFLRTWELGLSQERMRKCKQTTPRRARQCDDCEVEARGNCQPTAHCQFGSRLVLPTARTYTVVPAPVGSTTRASRCSKHTAKESCLSRVSTASHAKQVWLLLAIHVVGQLLFTPSTPSVTRPLTRGTATPTVLNRSGARKSPRKGATQTPWTDARWRQASDT